MSGNQGYIVIANHPTLIDVVVLLSFVKDASCVVKDSLFRTPIIGRILRGAGYISNKSSENILENCRTALENGDNLIMFPEGTRTTPGKPLELKRSAAQLSLRTNAKIRAIKIKISHLTLYKDSPWYNVPEKKAHMIVSVEHVVNPADYLSKYRSIAIAARKLTEDLHEVLSI